MSRKYLIIGGVALVLNTVAIVIESAVLLGIGFYFALWSFIGDVLSNVTWQKHTTINTKKVEYYQVDKDAAQMLEDKS